MYVTAFMYIYLCIYMYVCARECMCDVCSLIKSHHLDRYTHDYSAEKGWRRGERGIGH